MHHHITRRGLLVGTAAIGVGGLGAFPAFAQQAGDAAGRTYHALLVAVTAYPNLPPKASLVGPNNDASLVREFLLNNAPVTFEPQNVAVLADGIESTASPTRGSIRDALDRLADTVKSGDFVYLQFSGHGTQQPAMDPAIEPDGLDECFLPADTGMWEDRSKGIPNALIDKEFRDHLQKIRDKGAFIWAVFDCCHSGTMTRAVTESEETERKIDFTDLGIPEAAMAEAIAEAQGPATRGMGEESPRQNSLGITSAEPTGAESIAPGGMVAFFAAQNTETTPEMPLPKGDPEATKLGLFTYTVFAKIAENPAMTYRQLGQAVLQAYSGDNRMRPTPLFEGDLDRQVFGSTPEDRIAQWAIKAENGMLEIPAGQLHRLSPGTKLAILASPAATLDQAVGYVEVQSAKNLTSRVVPVAHEGLPALAVADVPVNSWARLTELAIGFELVVARPGGGDSPAETELLNAALDKIVDEKKVPVNLRLVDAGEAADLTLAVMSEMDVGIIIADQARQSENAARASLSTEPRVWLLPPSAELSLEDGRRSPSLPLAGSDIDDIAAKLAEDLVRIFRATSLSRLSAASEFRPNEVEVGFKIKRTQAADAEPLRAGTVPVVHPDDEVHIEAKSASAKPVDINVLYIGSDYSISHMYAERLSSGSEIDLPLLAFTDSSYGIERMVVVLSEAEPQTPVEDLSFLEQVGVRQATRSLGGGAATFGELLREVAAAPATRGAARLGDKAGAKGAVLIFPMETTPRG
ncbi:MAG: caspase family protein [Aquamicrobium sp.]|uniref:caspase family protein n=1 Tax=Aquamicrobium sp. TaxID=1872579 RepID=UPI00349EBA6F|nr:caspase family protein [Aquamicrobium sp.]